MKRYCAKEPIEKTMFKTIPINYVYMSADIEEKFKAAVNVAGWGKATILTQIAQTYGKVNADYYYQSAELDAVARGMKHHQGEHFELLANWDELPPYKSERPIFGPTPLATISNPDRSLPRHSFSQFKCSTRNAAILKMALIVEETNIQILMSKMFVWYYSKYWHLYQPQLQSIKQKTISPNLKPLK